jgi:DNA mismatch repair ATPase MutS
VKVFLMHRDRDFDLERELPPNEAALTQDLELETLLDAMAAGDEFLLDVARKAVLSSLDDPEAIVYRQHVLADCLDRQPIVRAIYDIAVEATQVERQSGMYLSLRHASPDMILSRSVRVLEALVAVLKRLRKLADEEARKFRSEGFERFFAMIEDELDDEYLQTLQRYLKELKFERGVLISAQLGKGNKGTRHVLRRPRPRSWVERISGKGPASYAFTIPPRDEHGFQALGELRGKGINLVANALGQSTDHVVSFFRMLRTELAFYLGCLNLHARLTEKDEPTCFPTPMPADTSALSARGLYDAALTLHLKPRVIGNDVNADGKSLVMITGANQGGKSTFLRSVGLAQLMMQSGMFAPAESLRANVSAGVFTHYKREEDASMESGKLDEELSRMSEIADRIAPSCILLCNESFAATNEREGSEIARQVVRAMTEAGIKVLFVTHLYDLAHGIHAQHLDTALFLRAERQPDGRRTFRLVEGEPLPTSYGEDSYRRIFGVPLDDAVPANAKTR